MTRISATLRRGGWGLGGGLTLAGLIWAVTGTPAGAIEARIVPSRFLYDFHVNGTLDEIGSSDDSSSPYFWLNSGGRFLLKDGIGKTIQGDLPVLDKWRLAYALSNPRDTDNGAHPQNLLRLLTRSRWLNVRQTLSFRIAKLNLSDSPERDGWSGILLFSRYLDGANLYYLGLRQDGTAVIKKKLNGIYYTLAQAPAFPSSVPYNRDTNPNLIPGERWIKLRSVVKNVSPTSVKLQVFLDPQLTGNWQRLVEVTDDAGGTDGPPILSDGYGGIRTDYMDMEFDDYIIENAP